MCFGAGRGAHLMRPAVGLTATQTPAVATNTKVARASRAVAAATSSFGHTTPPATAATTTPASAALGAGARSGAASGSTNIAVRPARPPASALETSSERRERGWEGGDGR